MNKKQEQNQKVLFDSKKERDKRPHTVVVTKGSDRGSGSFSGGLSLRDNDYSVSKSHLHSHLDFDSIYSLDPILKRAYQKPKRTPVEVVEDLVLNRAMKAISACIKKMPTQALSELGKSSSDEEVLLGVFEKTLDKDFELPIRIKSALLAIKNRREMLEGDGGCFSAVEAAGFISVDRQTVNAKRVRGELLGVKVGKGYHYPVWQFKDGSVVKGLVGILKSFHERELSQWAQISFFLNANKYLLVNLPDYPRPIEALLNNKLEQVANAAKTYLTQGAI